MLFSVFSFGATHNVRAFKIYSWNNFLFLLSENKKKI
jgi:hypothetical protein